jgi:plasmid stability protein
MELIQNHTLHEDPMASLSIKNVPEETLSRLRIRAVRNHRSLQQELLAIVEAAADESAELSVDALAQYVDSLGLSTAGDTSAWLRELRDGR